MSINKEIPYTQIFEVKINEQKLCHFMESLSIKISHIEEGLRSVNAAISKNTIMDELKMFAKYCVKEENAQTYSKIAQKFDNFSRELNRIDSSLRNSQKNLRTQFEGLRQKQKLIQKSIAYIISHEITDITNRMAQLDQLQKAYKAQNSAIFQEIKEKEVQFQGKYDYIQEKFMNLDEKTMCIQQSIKESNKKIDELRKMDEVKRGNHTLYPSNFSHKMSKVSARRTMGTGQLQKSFDAIKENHQFQLQNIEPIQQIKPKYYPNRRKDSVHRNSGFSLNRSEQIQQQTKQKQNFIQPSLKKSESSCNLQHKNRAKKNSVRKSAVFQPQQLTYFQGRQQQNKRSSFAAVGQLRKIVDKITALQNRSTILEESQQSFKHQISKISTLQSTIQSKIDQIEKFRVDSSSVAQVKLRFNQINAAMELQQAKYISGQTFNKFSEGLKQRIVFLEDMQPLHAKKEEVQAALQFLEAKIKEIVVVISSRFEEEKLGAINRVQQTRCLTCNKQQEFSRPGTRAKQPTSFRRLKTEAKE